MPLVIRTPLEPEDHLRHSTHKACRQWRLTFQIKVVVPSTAVEAQELLKQRFVMIIRYYFEHKMMYNSKFEVPDEVEPIPFGKANICKRRKDITIVATSSMVVKSLQAAEKLAKDGIDAEVIDLRTIVPLDRETIIESVKKTGKLLITDEAYERCGIGSEIAADVMEDVFYYLDMPILRLCNPNVSLPFSPVLEFPIIPSADKVYEKVEEVFR